MDDRQLWLDAQTMRELGYRAVDAIVERLARPWDDRPVVSALAPQELAQRLGGPAPENARPFDDLLRQLDRDVFTLMARNEHPGYLAYIPGCGTWPGALGDLLASAFNMDVGHWQLAAGPSQLELTVLDWFKDWIGYPSAAAGVLTSGGSAANMTALACAREARVGAMSDRLVIYCADQTHSSVARGARILGFRPDQVRVLPVDARFRLRPDMLVAAMDADVRAGRQPLLVSANAGATSTGAVDPLVELAAICRERGVWLHVDGAYGGFAVLTERGRRALAGLNLADSVTLDPHKWLYQPFEVGCLLVRDGHLLRSAFEIVPDYLRDVKDVSAEVNFADLGMQLSRTSHAVKVWLSIQYFGLATFRAAIDRCLDLVEHATARIEASAGLELMSPPSLGVVCFRRKVTGQDEDSVERANAALVRSLSETSIGFVSTTRLRGQSTARLCILNHTTTRADVDAVLDHFEYGAIVMTTAPPTEAADRDPPLDASWLGPPRVEPAIVRGLPLFAFLGERDVDRVARIAREVEVPRGAAVVEQWQTGDEFFVIVDGSVSVVKDGKHVSDLGPGDHFGELAALDWGARFAYPRLATILASSDVRLLVLPGAFFNELLHDVPSLAAAIRGTVRERLAHDLTPPRG